jgi:hypothetical protein
MTTSKFVRIWGVGLVLAMIAPSVALAAGSASGEGSWRSGNQNSRKRPTKHILELVGVVDGGDDSGTIIHSVRNPSHAKRNRQPHATEVSLDCVVIQTNGDGGVLYATGEDEDGSFYEIKVVDDPKSGDGFGLHEPGLTESIIDVLFPDDDTCSAENVEERDIEEGDFTISGAGSGASVSSGLSMLRAFSVLSGITE